MSAFYDFQKVYADVATPEGDVAVFYLRSRGIGEEAARSLLTYAFAADIVERIKVAPVRHELEEFLFRRLPKGEVVRQAV